MKNNPRNSALRYGGAIVAFLIGSGFASGQEVMQFFTAYGLTGSLLGCGLSFAIMYLFTSAVLRDARNLQLQDTNSIFRYYCGKTLGRVFSWVIPAFLFMVYVVMLSGAGSLLEEYYGLPALAGRLAMAALSLITVLLGLRKLVDVIGRIGPAIILSIVIIGAANVLLNLQGIRGADGYVSSLPITKATPWWWLSSITYASFCCLTLFAFLAGIGRDMDHKMAKAGSLLGNLGFMGSAAVISLAMLSCIQEVHGLNMPAVYLADRLFPGLGIAFSLIMFCGIFTTAVPMLWSACNKVSTDEKSLRFRIGAVILVLIGCFGGLLPFSTLVNIVYPYMGYIGFIPLIGVAWTHLRRRR